MKRNQERVVSYQGSMPWASAIFFAHFFFGHKIYRTLDFWRPTGWDDLNWRFFAALGGVTFLWSATFWAVWRYFKTRRLVFEVTPESMLSVQRSPYGLPTSEPRRVSLSDIISVESADAKWIKFVVRDDEPFDLAVGTVRGSKRRRLCEILAEAGFRELHALTGIRRFRIPRFTIRSVMQLTLLVAVLSAAYRWSVIDFGIHPIAGALVCVGTVFLVGWLVVMAGAIWVAKTDSKRAHKCVTAGGFLMVASFPASIFVAMFFEGPQLLENFELVIDAIKKFGIVPTLYVGTLVSAVVGWVAWLLFHLYNAYRQQT